MRKNSYLIERAKELQKLKRMTEDNSAYIYASFGVVLHNIGYTDEQIEEIFNQTVTVHETNPDVIAECEKLTGIALYTREGAEREGIIPK